MMQNRHWNKTCIPILVCMLSVGLMFSFGLHAVQIEHVHFTAIEGHGDAHGHESTVSILGEYMHLADKKVIFLILLTSVSLWTFLELKISFWERILGITSRLYTSHRNSMLVPYRIFDYVRIFLREGTIHTKAH